MPCGTTTSLRVTARLAFEWAHVMNFEAFNGGRGGEDEARCRLRGSTREK
jgi:hypothetical protein